MENKTSASFQPEYAIPPGVTLLETLEALSLSQAELAERMGRPKKTINEIIKGKAAVTPETAIQLERVLGISASFWINLEQTYRTTLARLDERKKLAGYLDWLKLFPVKKMCERGWIDQRENRIELLEELLTFFGVVSPDAWEITSKNIRAAVAFRQSKAHLPDFGAVSAWLRRGELLARKIPISQYDPKRFKESLSKIRACTGDDPATYHSLLENECGAAGVAVVLVPELPKLRICGAARWIAPAIPMIQLSLYYKRDDHFWFSFFHEAAHILLHGRNGFFVDIDMVGSVQEEEANSFAANFLIPQSEYDSFCANNNFSSQAIFNFSKALKIAPGIIVGRLQHDKLIGFSERNELKRSFEWAN